MGRSSRRSSVVGVQIDFAAELAERRLGDVVPKHTVYYLIPKDHVDLEELAEYLNGPEARAWLEANCQMAANGFYRLQTTVMEDLPVPERFGEVIQETLV